MKVYPVENHPNDSRAKICEDGIVQTLSSRMGTGGNNTPFVLIEHEQLIPVCVMATSHWNAPFTDGTITPTVCARAGTGGNQLPLVVLKKGNEVSY